MLTLYHDEDSLGTVVEALRRSGFDCLTALDAGMRARTDADHLALATQLDRVLFTKNTGDFRRLDSQWRIMGRRHAGIVALTNQRTPVGVQVRAMESLARTYDERSMRGRFVFLLNFA